MVFEKCVPVGDVVGRPPGYCLELFDENTYNPVTECRDGRRCATCINKSGNGAAVMRALLGVTDLDDLSILEQYVIPEAAERYVRLQALLGLTAVDQSKLEQNPQLRKEIRGLLDTCLLEIDESSSDRERIVLQGFARLAEDVRCVTDLMMWQNDLVKSTMQSTVEQRAEQMRERAERVIMIFIAAHDRNFAPRAISISDDARQTKHHWYTNLDVHDGDTGVGQADSMLATVLGLSQSRARKIRERFGYEIVQALHSIPELTIYSPFSVHARSTVLGMTDGYFFELMDHATVRPLTSWGHKPPHKESYDEQVNRLSKLFAVRRFSTLGDVLSAEYADEIYVDDVVVRSLVESLINSLRTALGIAESIA